MTIYVLCVRDPDESNEFTIYPADADVDIIDVDLGRADLSDWNEFVEWASSQFDAVEVAPAHLGEEIEGIVWAIFERYEAGWALERIEDIRQLSEVINHIEAQ